MQTETIESASNEELTPTEKINQLHNRVLEARESANQAMNLAIKFAITCGRELFEIKKNLNDQSFVTWCHNYIEFDRRTAYRYMDVAKKYGNAFDEDQELPSLYQAYKAISDERKEGQEETESPRITPPKHITYINQLCEFINTHEELSDTEANDLYQLYKLLHDRFANSPNPVAMEAAS
jgi:hypothetical protein